QSEACGPRAALLDALEQRLVEMQAGGRRRDGAGLRGIHRLVALDIFTARGMRDVRRQGRAAVALEYLVNIDGEAHTVELAFASFHRGAHLTDQDLGAGLGRMAGSHQRERPAIAEGALDEELHLPAARLAAKEPRLDD